MNSDTKEKLEDVLKFLRSPSHKLIGNESEFNGIQLSKSFDVKLSKAKPTIDFSESVVVRGYEEAVDLVDRVAKNAHREDIETDLLIKLAKAGLELKESFYLTFIGKREPRLTGRYD